jgi:ribonucleoside-diphosphate reductase alpha chain
MSVKALQDYTFTAKYANYNKEFKRRETWEEAVNRVKNMMLEKYHDKDVKDEIEWAYNLVKEKRVIGSQRAMQFGGKPILKKNI